MFNRDVFGKAFDSELNSVSGAKEFEAVNKMIENASELAGYKTDLNIIIDDWSAEQDKRTMRVNRISRDNELFYRISIEDKNYVLTPYKDFRIVEVDGQELVSFALTNELQQLAYIGYILRQTKEWELEIIDDTVLAR